MPSPEPAPVDLMASGISGRVRSDDALLTFSLLWRRTVFPLNSQTRSWTSWTWFSWVNKKLIEKHGKTCKDRAGSLKSDKWSEVFLHCVCGWRVRLGLSVCGVCSQWKWWRRKTAKKKKSRPGEENLTQKAETIRNGLRRGKKSEDIFQVEQEKEDRNRWNRPKKS